MSEATRAIALQEAVKVKGDSKSYADVLTAAKAFHEFMTADSKPAQSMSTPGKEPAAPPPTKSAAKPAAKPATVKPTVKPPLKPVKSEEEAAAELQADADAEVAAETAAEEAAIGDEADPQAATIDDIGQVISDLLAGKKRNECVALLKKFGATSKSGVKPEDYGAFVQEGNAILVQS